VFYFLFPYLYFSLFSLGDTMEQISVDELHDRSQSLNSDDLILDVRTSDEFNAGHIEGAQNTPHEGVASEVENLKKYSTVYVHCKMGGRAKIAAQTLEGAGLDNIVCVSDGGMQRWEDMGWPLVK
jgi:rhodanese-related sulfurtransferase